MKWLVALACTCLSVGAFAQDIPGLQRQLDQTRQQIAQAEAAGMDGELLATLRQAMADVETSIREMEADATEATQAPSASEAAPAQAATVGAYPTRPNALTGDPACAAFDLTNYRRLGLEGGLDTQLKTMCAQAFEYYSMYLNAIRQGYVEADANKTYAAHQGAATNASEFYKNFRATRPGL